MKKKHYDNLPNQVSERAEVYLIKAKSLAEEWYGMDYGQELHALTVNLATAMMNMESSEIIASEIAEFSKQLKKGKIA